MTNRELIKAFKQGSTGNCVSIAIIKAGIEIFGMNNIFQTEQLDATFKVTMRDGVEVTFSEEELKASYDLSKFVVLDNQEVLDYAVFCFAAMAKRAQNEENDHTPSMTFEKAAASLNNGEYYLEGPHWLGLRHNVRSIGRKYIWQYKGVIGASRKHCFFASMGLEDDYGKIDKIGFTEKRFCKWFRIDETSIH